MKKENLRLSAPRFRLHDRIFLLLAAHVAISLCLPAAADWGRGPHAARPGGPQPELPEQGTWSNPGVPQQRPAAGG